MELVALYRERRETATAHAGTKTHLPGRGNMLWSRTPGPVYHNVDGLLLTYCAMRSLFHRVEAKGRRVTGSMIPYASGLCDATPGSNDRVFIYLRCR